VEPLPSEDDVTVSQIKDSLDKLGVNYSGVTLKDDLYSLLKQNWK